MLRTWCGLAALVVVVGGVAGQGVVGDAPTSEERRELLAERVGLIPGRGEPALVYPGVTQERFDGIVQALDAAAATIDLGAPCTVRRREPIHRRDGDPHLFLMGGRGGLFTSWHVEFDATKCAEQLRRLRPDVADDRRLLADWYRHAASEMLRATRLVYEAHGLGDEWEPQFEFEMMFHHPRESPQVRTTSPMAGVKLFDTRAAVFVGDRMTFLHDPPEGMSSVPERAEAPPRPMITLTVVPDEPRWEEHEAITGWIKATNSTGSTIRVQNLNGGWDATARLFDMSGKECQRFPVSPLLCGGIQFTPAYTVWTPGENRWRRFWIFTDPDGEGARWRAPPGRYILKCISEPPNDAIDVVLEDAEIVVIPKATTKTN